MNIFVKLVKFSNWTWTMNYSALLSRLVIGSRYKSNYDWKALNYIFKLNMNNSLFVSTRLLSQSNLHFFIFFFTTWRLKISWFSSQSERRNWNQTKYKKKERKDVMIQLLQKEKNAPLSPCLSFVVWPKFVLINFWKPGREYSYIVLRSISYWKTENSN